MLFIGFLYLPNYLRKKSLTFTIYQFICVICEICVTSSIIHLPSSIIHHPSSIFHHPSSIIHHPSDIRQAYEYKLFIRFPFICAKLSFHIFHYNVSISFSVKPVRSAIVTTSKPRAFILRAMSRLCSARPSIIPSFLAVSMLSRSMTTLSR